MEFSYIIGKSVEKETCRIIHERLTSSAKYLKNKEYSPEFNIHEIRKNMKKVRASLRLVKDFIGKGNYKNWNKQARDIARIGSNIRNKYVILNTIKKLKERYEYRVDDFYFQFMYNQLEQEYKMSKIKLLDEQQLFSYLLKIISEFITEADKLRLDKDGFEAL
jgi:hypothetical protein